MKNHLNKKIIICRKITERPESIGTHGFLCDYPENLSGIFDNLINNYIVSDDCPFGDAWNRPWRFLAWHFSLGPN